MKDVGRIYSNELYDLAAEFRKYKLWEKEANEDSEDENDFNCPQYKKANYDIDDDEFDLNKRRLIILYEFADKIKAGIYDDKSFARCIC